mmetsp:Transcript_2859/g.7117  ORF Transcript_2859/g.7117 Transcript_2859/m.7117 type:complete len:424 (+) Transcript_2859:379-1650(+)
MRMLGGCREVSASATERACLLAMDNSSLISQFLGRRTGTRTAGLVSRCVCTTQSGLQDGLREAHAGHDLRGERQVHACRQLLEELLRAADAHLPQLDARAAPPRRSCCRKARAAGGPSERCGPAAQHLRGIREPIAAKGGVSHGNAANPGACQQAPGGVPRHAPNRHGRPLQILCRHRAGGWLPDVHVACGIPRCQPPAEGRPLQRRHRLQHPARGFHQCLRLFGMLPLHIRPQPRPAAVPSPAAAQLPAGAPGQQLQRAQVAPQVLRVVAVAQYSDARRQLDGQAPQRQAAIIRRGGKLHAARAARPPRESAHASCGGIFQVQPTVGEELGRLDHLHCRASRPLHPGNGEVPACQRPGARRAVLRHLPRPPASARPHPHQVHPPVRGAHGQAGACGGARRGGRPRQPGGVCAGWQRMQLALC